MLPEIAPRRIPTAFRTPRAAGAADPLITGGFFSEVIENCQTEQHKRK
jgi:hypothetical protein